jgi:multiple sugar transport system ATP-binding protein
MADVQLSNLRKVYPNGHVAVADASLRIADGELLVLVGPSGCGKSTLLRMIAGLESITGGTLRIGGRVVNDVAPKDRDIAMVFQSYALYPHMSVADNLAFGLKLRGHDRAAVAARVEEAARMLELGPVLDRKPGQLSGGQRQRVALGRALVRHPQVFLLDEPLSNLDAKLRAGMRVEIARLHRQLGTTMVYVTHDQIEAMTLGQRIAVLKDGQIQQVDTPMALYERPANLFVATFLGSPAMNVFAGTLVEDGGLRLRMDDAARIALPRGFEVPADRIGREWRIGVRPEDLHRCDPDDAHLVPVVEVVEPVGSEAFANLRLGGQTLVVRLSPRDLPAPGDALPLRIDAQRLHMFDPVTGNALAV